MSDYLENPQKIHSDIINALKAVSVIIIPAAGLFLFNIAMYSYKMAYFDTFNLPFIPLESSIWLDVVQNKTLVILLLTLLFFVIGFIVGGIFMFRHSIEKVSSQEFSWPVAFATFLLLSPFIFSLPGIAFATRLSIVIIYAFFIPFAFTRHFHDLLHHASKLLPKFFFLKKKEKAVLHDVAFIILGVTYLFVVFTLFILLMEFVAGKLGEYHAREKEQIMLSGDFKLMPEHILVNRISIYLEGCDSRRCVGYQTTKIGKDTIIQPRFFTVDEINFLNPETIEDGVIFE